MSHMCVLSVSDVCAWMRMCLRWQGVHMPVYVLGCVCLCVGARLSVCRGTSVCVLGYVNEGTHMTATRVCVRKVTSSTLRVVFVSVCEGSYIPRTCALTTSKSYPEQCPHRLTISELTIKDEGPAQPIESEQD